MMMALLRLFLLLMVELLASFRPSMVEIWVMEVRSDGRTIIPFDEFGFTRNGFLELNVSGISLSEYTLNRDRLQLGFFFSTRDAWIHVLQQIQEHEITCPLESSAIKNVYSHCRRRRRTSPFPPLRPLPLISGIAPTVPPEPPSSSTPAPSRSPSTSSSSLPSGGPQPNPSSSESTTTMSMEMPPLATQLISPFAITDAPPEPKCTTSPALPPSSRPDPRNAVSLPSAVAGDGSPDFTARRPPLFQPPSVYRGEDACTNVKTFSFSFSN